MRPYGYKKNIIIVFMGMVNVVMINSTIKAKLKPYETEVGFLSLGG